MELSSYLRSALEQAKIPANAKVLDAPTGFGRHAHWLSLLGNEVVAVDLNAQRIAAARKAAPLAPHPISWRKADLQEPLDFLDGSFDLMVCIHYFAESIVARADEALKPGGLFVLETFGGHGENWRALPRRGWASRALGTFFEIVSLKETPVGPDKKNVSLRAIARKNL